MWYISICKLQWKKIGMFISFSYNLKSKLTILIELIYGSYVFSILTPLEHILEDNFSCGNHSWKKYFIQCVIPVINWIIYTYSLFFTKKKWWIAHQFSKVFKAYLKLNSWMTVIIFLSVYSYHSNFLFKVIILFFILLN